MTAILSWVGVAMAGVILALFALDIILRLWKG